MLDITKCSLKNKNLFNLVKEVEQFKLDSGQVGRGPSRSIGVNGTPLGGRAISIWRRQDRVRAHFQQRPFFPRMGSGGCDALLWPIWCSRFGLASLCLALIDSLSQTGAILFNSTLILSLLLEEVMTSRARCSLENFIFYSLLETFSLKHHYKQLDLKKKK